MSAIEHGFVKPGAKVHYTAPHGKKENGIVKRISDDRVAAFVVYNCAGEWDNYRNYTAARTNLRDIKYGWVDESGKLMKEFCDHYYIPTNSKWQSAAQVQCQFCGDIIE